MRAKANSAVWYGSTIIKVVPANQVANARLAEDGSTRITEDGETRTLEAA
jgi:hypothetical protein